MRKTFILVLLALLPMVVHTQFLEKVSPIDTASVGLSISLVAFDAMYIVGDIASTSYCLNHSGYETNVVGAYLWKRPPALIVTKLGITMLNNFFVKEIYKVSPITAYIFVTIFNVGMVLIIHNNYAIK